MSILILGATGRTGKWVLKEAVDKGYTVHALVRDKNKCSMASPYLHLFEGTPSDPVALREAIKGCETVISALNISRTSDFPWSPLRTPETFLSKTLTHLINLCEEFSIKRLILISAWGVGDTHDKIPAWFRWTIDHSNIRFAYHEHQRQEDLLQASKLHWTAVRPVGLFNSSKPKVVKTSLNNHPKPSLLISRHNLARFIVDLLQSEAFIKQAPVVFQ